MYFLLVMQSTDMLPEQKAEFCMPALNKTMAVAEAEYQVKYLKQIVMVKGEMMFVCYVRMYPGIAGGAAWLP